MIIEGKITWVSEVRNTGKENGVTIEVTEQNKQYPESVLIEIYGDQKVENFFKYNELGDLVKAEFNIRAKELADGRRFNNISLWRIEKASQN
jgi:hypothetical protein